MLQSREDGGEDGGEGEDGAAHTACEDNAPIDVGSTKAEEGMIGSHMVDEDNQHAS